MTLTKITRFKKVSALAEVLNFGDLGLLKNHALATNTLDQILGLYLDAHLRQLIRVASYRQGSLTLACRNATVAGQIRYLSHIYTQQLRQHPEFCDIKRITAVITTANAGNTQTARTQPKLQRLSLETAELLLSVANSVEDREVSQALRRLASHTTEKKDEA